MVEVVSVYRCGKCKSTYGNLDLARACEDQPILGDSFPVGMLFRINERKSDEKRYLMINSESELLDDHRRRYNVSEIFMNKRLFGGLNLSVSLRVPTFPASEIEHKLLTKELSYLDDSEFNFLRTELISRKGDFMVLSKMGDFVRVKNE